MLKILAHQNKLYEIRKASQHNKRFPTIDKISMSSKTPTSVVQKEDNFPAPSLAGRPMSALQCIPPTSPETGKTIPQLAHFHLYLSPTVTTPTDLAWNIYTRKNRGDKFLFDSTPSERKYSIDIQGALSNIIDFVEKNPGHKVYLWTNKESEKIIRKTLLDNELSPALFKKITFSNIDGLFEKWDFDPNEKKLLYKFFRQEMAGAGKNLAAAKDIAQYAVLEAYGGLGIDCDVATKRSIGQLKSPSGILINLQKKPLYHPTINNNVLAATPHHKTILKTIEHISHTYQGNWHPLPEIKLKASESCAIYHDYLPEPGKLTQEESFELLTKAINNEKRFDYSHKQVGGTLFNYARVGITVAASGPGALRCGMHRTVSITHEKNEYSFENNAEIFGHLSKSNKLKKRFNESRENNINQNLLCDSKSWSAFGNVKRRDSF
ncbi:hypothetical protein [Serratia sp. M24T3]|uniref:hypothetical protein n=1 Tax=Serratia sp. M24T3 TaxID=932213 RepID=UPI00025B98F3|nr:hypothetical protein [Serratia sp. M24T3]EIC84091.1 hypothetical protein SPM24T3_13236 [Serratia sp. M24T3]